MYSKIGEISEACQEELLISLPRMETHYGEKTCFECAPNLNLSWIEHPELDAFWPRDRWVNALAVRLPPGGLMHLHDHPDDRTKTKYHIVLSTNDECTCINGGVESHLELRGVYRMEPMLMHESFNRGQTGRTHLIVEVANDP